MKYFVIFLVFSFINYSLGCTGCVNLDELTFEKVIKKFSTVLVKFDQQFPYGDTHEAFSSFASQINNKTISGADHSDILIGTVGIKDYGELDNIALGQRYGISKRQDGPVIKLFIDGDVENPIDMKIGKPGVTLNQLYSFVKANSKVHIQVPGCWKELDEFADLFVKDAKMRKEIVKKAEKFIEKIESEEKKKLAKTYIALMKGVMDKGEDYILKQKERMTKLLTDKLSEKKITELNLKLNIVGSFRFSTKTSNTEL